MQENYTEVPNIISGKDLDYLSDMFNWNYLAYKKTINFASNVTDQEIKDIFNKIINVFHSSMTKVLNIINTGGNYEQSNQ